MPIDMDMIRAVKHLVSWSAIVLCLTACDDHGEPNDLSPGNAHLTGEFDLQVPEQLISTRAIDLDALFAVISINGVEQPRWDQSTQYTSTFTVEKGDTLDLQISWFETLADDTELLLASTTINQVITTDTELALTQEDYETSGERFDLDSDNFSNIVERRAGSNPVDGASTPLNLPDIRIQEINPADAPRIDGLYDQSWNNATFSEANGALLFIDNLMIDQGALRSDGDAEMRWFAMHDNVNLYIYVLGESVEIATPNRDSTEVWQDDAISIFIDGDNSKDQIYDGVDDRQMIIPLLTDPDNLTSNSTFFVTGFNSASIPEFDFATCLCISGQYTWEISLRLEDFGIEIGRSFGIDVQLEVDHDGGSRDAKWGWFHPSRTTQDIDNTWFNPSFMGTAIVE